jgi:hypothetical protein
VGEVQAGDGGDLEPADLGPAVAVVAGVVGDGDLAPRQDLELLVQRASYAEVVVMPRWRAVALLLGVSALPGSA